MKKLIHWITKKESLLFLGIILLAIVLRFYLLGQNPPSLDWDEVSMGYNAYSIFKTGADEYGNFLPLSIRSFDDYKPPVYTYLTVPSVAFFGLTSWAVRLPAAVFGVLAVIVVYFLTQELVYDLPTKGFQGKLKQYVPLASAFFLAASPWHLQFSRAAFEGNIGVFFFCLSYLFLLKGLRKSRYLLLSVPFFVLCMYSYHSYRVIVPLSFLVCFSLFRKELMKRWMYGVVSLAVIALLCFPIFQSFLAPATGSHARLSMVTIFGNAEFLQPSIEQLEKSRATHNTWGIILNNRRIVYTEAIVKGYFDHFTYDFLFANGDGGKQHHPLNVGMMYVWDLPFLLIGLFVMLKNRSKKLLFTFILILLAPLPASITTGTPHAVRAIGMIPFLQIVVAIGFVGSLVYLWNKKNVVSRYIIPVLLCLLFIINFVYYLHQYYVLTPKYFAVFWQYGYKEAFAKTSEIDKNYDRVIFTYHYDQPYIYYLFYNKIDPSWYQKHWDINKTGQLDRMYRVIGKYEFRNIDWSKDSQRKKTLIVASPNEVPSGINSIDDIKFPDGQIAFRIIAL